MQHFTYQAYEASGILKSGELSAPDRTEALKHLRMQGLVPKQLELAHPGVQLPWWQKEISIGPKVSRKNIAVLTRELAMLLQADLPMDEALETVALQPALDKRMRKVISSMRQDVIAGASLGQAMQQRIDYFPDFLPRLVQAGEASGALAEALDDIGKYFEATDSARTRILSALLYPAILVMASLAAIGVVAGVLLPSIVPLIKDAGADLPLILQVADTLTQMVRHYWPVMVTITIVLLGGLFLAFVLSGSVRTAISSLLLRLPVVGQVILHSGTMRYTRTLAMLLRNGVPMLQGLSSAAAAVENTYLRRQLAKAESMVGSGKSVSDALREIAVLPTLVVRFSALGEQTGELPGMFDRAADIYLASVRQKLDRIVVLITPVLTLVVGAIVGGLILSVMSALFAINNLAM